MILSASESIFSKGQELDRVYAGGELVWEKISGGGTTLLDGLIACWEFNEVGGGIAYDAHASNDMNVVGCNYNNTGKIGKCYGFTGNTCNVKNLISNTNFDNLTQKTISIWFNVSFFGTVGTHLFNKSYWFMAFDKNYNRHIFGQDFTSGYGRWSMPLSALSLNNWHHWVICFDSSNLSNNPIFYVDGVSVSVTRYGSGSRLPLKSDVGKVLQVGNTHPQYDRSAYGLIDQPCIWNRILTQAEITTLYNSGNGLPYSSF